MELIDQIGRLIHLKTIPKRIVSLVPSQTELLCDLGLEALLVGVTKFCVHPQHLISNVTLVGGTKQIHLDRIKALQPDIILCNKEENTREIVVACEHICNVHVSDVETIADNEELILQYGKLFDRSLKAEEISNNIQEKLQNFKTFVKNKPSFKVAYFIWRDPWMVAGNGTFINHLLQCNGLVNVFGKLNRYPEIDITKLDDNFDIVLLSSEPYPFQKKHIDQIHKLHPLLKVILVDGEYFSWYGSRLLLAIDYFKALRQEL